MPKFLNLVSLHELGKPLPPAQLQANRTIFRWLVAVPTTLLALVLVGAFIYFFSSGQYILGIPAFILGFVIVFTAIALEDLANNSALDPTQCLQMLEWSKQYPTVYSHIQAINNLYRPIAQSDYYFIQKHVLSLERDALASEAAAACKTLNNLS